MKKLVFILLALLAGIGAEAQETLIPISKKERKIISHSKELKLYDEEIKRLLIPAATEFGMICKPSLSREFSLTYDPIAHALVYIEADESIWGGTNTREYWDESLSKTVIEEKTSYHAPGTNMYTLPISDEMAKSLKRLWKVAINQAKPMTQNILDGTGWEYFIGKKRAKIQVGGEGGKGKVGSLINLCIELREAVRKNDPQKMESLYPKVDSLYQVFEKK